MSTEFHANTSNACNAPFAGILKEIFPKCKQYTYFVGAAEHGVVSNSSNMSSFQTFIGNKYMLYDVFRIPGQFYDIPNDM